MRLDINEALSIINKEAVRLAWAFLINRPYT